MLQGQNLGAKRTTAKGRNNATSGKSWSAANEDIAALVKTMTEKLYASFSASLDVEAKELTDMNIADIGTVLDKP